MEPAALAQHAWAPGSLAQCDYYQPYSRPAADPEAGAGIRDVPRDASRALSGGPQRSPPPGAYEGVPRGGKAISRVQRSQGNVKADCIAATPRRLGRGTERGR